MISDIVLSQVKSNKQRNNEAAQRTANTKRNHSDKENEEEVEVHDLLGEQGEQDVIF